MFNMSGDYVPAVALIQDKLYIAFIFGQHESIKNVYFSVSLKICFYQCLLLLVHMYVTGLQ